MERLLTYIVFFVSASISFISGQKLAEMSKFTLKKRGILIVIIGSVLSLLNFYFLTINMPVIPSNHLTKTTVFFWKYFWFIMLYIIFLKHILIEDRNFRYYFSLSVVSSALFMTLFEFFTVLWKPLLNEYFVSALWKPLLNEYFVSAFIGWFSYFGIFGGIGAGLLLGCLRKIKDFNISWKNIIAGFFYILLLGILSFFIPLEAFSLNFIVPVLVYIVSFVIFDEVIDTYRIFAAYLKRK